MPRTQGNTMQELQFTLIKTPNNKYHALCQICDRQLCNTAASRLQAHRKKCRPNGNDEGVYMNPLRGRIVERRFDRDTESDKAESYAEEKEITTYYADVDEKVTEEEEIGLQIVDFENTVTKDECIAFGQYVSTQLRKMDSRTCAIVKYKISEILFNAEIGNIQTD